MHVPNTVPPSAPPQRIPLAVYLHPFELLLAVVLVLVGLRSLGLGVDTPESLRETVGPPVSVAWLVGNLLGGGLVLVGVLGHARAFLRALEKAGLYLVASTTAAYAVALASVLGATAVYTVAQLAAITVACLIRARAIYRAELAILAQLEAVNALRAEVHPVELVRPVDPELDRRTPEAHE